MEAIGAKPTESYMNFDMFLEMQATLFDKHNRASIMSGIDPEFFVRKYDWISPF